MPVKFEFLLDTRRWERRPSRRRGWPIRRRYRHRLNRPRFRPLVLQPQLPRPTQSGPQPSKKQDKSRQKPGYVRKEFAETWLWSEELVK